MILALIIAAVLVGCTTPEVKEISTEMEHTTKSNLHSIGVVDDSITIQKEDTLADELRTMEYVNDQLRHKANCLSDELMTCQMTIAKEAKSLSVPPMTVFDEMKDDVPEEEIIGLEGGDLKIVKRQNYKKRLAAEKRYERTLRKFIRIMKKDLGVCEAKLELQASH